MRKQIFCVFFLGLIFIGTKLPIAGAEEVASYDWSDKLLRGALNMVTSPIEIARSIHTTTEDKNLAVGWTIGLAKGLADGLVRFGAGFIDFVTFPFNFPDDEKAPLLDPEYVWEKPGPPLV